MYFVWLFVYLLFVLTFLLNNFENYILFLCEYDYSSEWYLVIYII